MGKVCAITGGGSGMGLAVAHEMGRRGYEVVLAGRTVSKLDGAIRELTAQGIAARACRCDVADRGQAEGLAAQAAELGEVRVVIHAAGLSPHMADPQSIMAVNALGTVNVNDAFLPVMAVGGCVVDVSSMAAHMAPELIMPSRAYPLARTNRVRFMRAMMRRVRLFPKTQQRGVAYSISKHFVVWLAQADAGRFGERGVRVVSVCPGVFDTPMGEVELEDGRAFIEGSALKRLGRPEEIAYLFATIADPRNGYLTGADIVCDGGVVASRHAAAAPVQEEVGASAGAPGARG